jgi:hypothetical protein
MQLNEQQAKVIASLLDLAFDRVANCNCNDFDLAELLPDPQERRDLMRRYHEYNGDPEEFDPEDDYDTVEDYALMGYFAAALRGEAT